MIRRMIPLAVAIVLVVGCGKKATDTNSGGDGDPNATYTLKFRDEQKGDKTEQTVTETGTAEISFGGKGEKEKEDKNLTFTEEILEMTGDKPTKLTRKYTVAKRYSKVDKTVKTLPFEGKTVLIEKKGDIYEFTADGKKMDFIDSVELMSEFSGSKKDSGKMDELLPKKAVKVGESWDIDVNALKSLGGDSPFPFDPAKSKVTGKLDKAYTKDGKQWGVISFTIDATIDSKAGKGKGEVSGTVKASGTIDAVIDGSARDGTMKINLKMDMGGKEGKDELKIAADMVMEKTVKTAK